jgi:hypothetical protein
MRASRWLSSVPSLATWRISEIMNSSGMIPSSKERFRIASLFFLFGESWFASRRWASPPCGTLPSLRRLWL